MDGAEMNRLEVIDLVLDRYDKEIYEINQRVKLLLEEKRAIKEEQSSWKTVKIKGETK